MRQALSLPALPVEVANAGPESDAEPVVDAPRVEAGTERYVIDADAQMVFA
jgi:hypothetical protein